MTEDLRQQLQSAVGAPGAPPVERIVARGEQFARRRRIRRAGIATGLVLVIGAGVGGFASARRGPAGRVEVRGATPVSPMTEPAVTVPLTPDRVAGELKTLQGTDPILLPAGIPADWTPQVSTSATTFSVTYAAPDGIESVSLSIAIPNPPEPLPATTQRTLTFRRDPKAFYQAQDGTVATTDRFLIWNEPGVWAADDPSIPQPHPQLGSVPYYLSSRGLTDSQFWAIANSLRPITTVTPPTTAPAPPTTIGSTVPATVIALSAVRWDQVTYPLQCGTSLQGPTPTQVLAVVYPQINPGTQVAALLVACHVGAGTPPRVLYVFDRASSPTTPHLLQTLSDDRSTAPTRVTSTISASGPDISANGYTYSSPDIPRCCPDGTFTARWTWTGSGYRQAP